MAKGDPIQPTLDDLQVAFDPETFWLPGDFDPAALIKALKQQPGLADFADDDKNAQSAVRLDVDEAGNQGFWVTIPKGTGRGPVDAAAAAYEPDVPPVPKPTVQEQLVAALDGAVLLDPKTATVADVAAAVNQVVAIVKQTLAG